MYGSHPVSGTLCHPPAACVSPHAVKEIRMVQDKFTGQPRGFAFVHFFTVADAAKALQALQVWGGSVGGWLCPLARFVA